ncbi:hypothetical protein [Anabaena azotica]|uniref:hypothetical protein n=1 Tax=Anabaena azotica TaxID=197653 RepID=UPI001F54D584|nr:hypothetical protein [Anabaena azotica]
MSIVRHKADKTNLVFIWLTSPTGNYEQQVYRLAVMAIADHCVKKKLATVNADPEVTQAMLNRFNRAIADLTAVVEYLEEEN